MTRTDWRSILPEGMKAAVALFGLIMPPTNHSEAAMYAWYKRVAVAIASLFILLLLFVAIAYGAVPGYGFAKKAEIEQISQNIDFLTEKSLTSEIRDLHDRVCRAPKGSDERSILSGRLYEDLNMYQKRYSTVYQLPTCNDL